MECNESRPRPPRPPPPNVTHGGELATREDTYSKLKRIHDEAFRHIESGLSLDEQGQIQEAIVCYEKGLTEMQKALGISADSDEIPSQHKEAARKFIGKMTKSKLQIEGRLQNLRPSAPQPLSEAGACAMDTSFDQPPSYEEATSSGPPSFMELGDSIYNNDTAAASNELTTNATEIYSISDGVQFFYITPEGFVSAPSYPGSLKVYKFEQGLEEGHPAERPPAFLQVGEWFYPLVPGVSPVLHASYGAYIFPDVGNPYAGSSVGLILPDSVSTEERQSFEELMTSLTALREQNEPIRAADLGEAGVGVAEEAKTPETEQERVSSKISRGIIWAADWVSWGVNKGAEKAGEYIRRGSKQLQSKIKVEEKPREIPQKYQKGMERARQATHAAVTVSGYVVNKLGEATAALGRYVAPHLKRQGQKLLPRSFSQKEKDGHSKIDSFMEVAASGLHGFGTVYVGLESAAKALAKNLANETVNVVNHKYGSEAAKFADHTLYATGNLAMTGYNVNHLGVKAIAKRAAKDTGKAVVMDFKKSKGDAEKEKPSENGSQNHTDENGEKHRHNDGRGVKQ